MRTGIVVIVVSALIILGFVVRSVWTLAYRLGEVPPKSVRIAELHTRASIQWSNQGPVTIEAASLNDATTALGYVHAFRHGFTMALWRQVALGRLGEWHLAQADVVDRLATKIGIGTLAQASFQHLRFEEQQWLIAFTAGVNAAWDDVRLQSAFLQLHVDPQPWQPWHSLAVERLLAWLSGSSAIKCALDEELCAEDRELRALLHVHSLEHSHAWLMQSAAGTALFHRLVSGSSQLPLLLEATIQVAGSPAVHGAAIVGTPFMPVGRMGPHAWAVLPTTSLRVAEAPAYDPAVARWITSTGEGLISFMRNDSLLMLRPDSVGLHWNGFASVSDARAWRSLLNGSTPTFSLLDGNGIRIAPDGSGVLGRPAVRWDLPNGVVVASDSFSQQVADYLVARHGYRPEPAAWSQDTYSPWAAEQVPLLLRQLDANADPRVQSAVTYLENWDYRFNGASIGATVFDAWLGVDSMDASVRLTYAVSDLVQRLGADTRMWRWERVFPGRLIHPLGFEPEIEVSGQGHFTTVAWDGAKGNAMAVWDMWTSMSADPTVYVRRQGPETRSHGTRRVLSNDARVVVELPAPAQRVTRLRP